MRFWAGVTDSRWYQFVRDRAFDEVNFWQPSTRQPFSGLPEGTPFLFKLKRPHHHIAGGGYFVRYTRLPLLTAWEVFGEQNGAGSLQEFVSLIGKNRSGEALPSTEIGCTVLTDVFFLQRENWIDATGLFAANIMVGRTYETAAEQAGRSIWQQLAAARIENRVSDELQTDQPRYGREFIARARLGQGSFRTLVIDAYKRRCAITGESTLPALEAAHIRAYASEGVNQVSNGLLLRSDFHKLFDAGLVTIDPDLHIHVSSRIRDEYYNGKAYYRLDKQPLSVLPDSADDLPNPEFLRWHNDQRFIA